MRTEETTEPTDDAVADAPASGVQPIGAAKAEEAESAGGSYLRFVAMILTAMAVMFVLTYVNSYRFADVHWSETRVFMTLVMGGAMAMIMLGFMLGMYRNPRVNVAIVAVAVIVSAIGIGLVRSQATVGDRSFMKAMIPHHSIAILTSARADIDDRRVRELADEINAAQRREIEEMQWLIEDIAKHGPATTKAQADARPVPDFTASDYGD